MRVLTFLETTATDGAYGLGPDGPALVVLSVTLALFLSLIVGRLLALFRRRLQTDQRTADAVDPAGAERASLSAAEDTLRRQPAAARRPAPDREPGRYGDRRTVLVVDDNITVIRILERALSDSYVVCSAQNGRDALSAVRDARPDLIISDIMMPVMDGRELCRKVKEDPALRHIPVVLLTALATEEDLIEGLELGSDDYMFKPFNARELRARVRNLIGAREELLQLAQRNHVLASECHSKTELLGHAAHDLKNPLAAIRELAEIVKEEVGPGSDAYEPARLIRQSSDQMLHLIGSLLESTAIETGQIPLEPRAIDVTVLAADVVRRNDTLARKKSQTVEFTAARSDCLVFGDEHFLFEAMDNLVNNAIKYSPHGGRIRVHVDRSDTQIRFSVTDVGPGLSEEEQGRLFRKFERLSPQPTAGESSTGLGLAIVKQIVDLHAGIVEVKSELGRGSTFAIELAAFEAAPAPEYSEK